MKLITIITIFILFSFKVCGQIISHKYGQNSNNTNNTNNTVLVNKPMVIITSTTGYKDKKVYIAQGDNGDDKGSDITAFNYPIIINPFYTELVIQGKGFVEVIYNQGKTVTIKKFKLNEPIQIGIEVYKDTKIEIHYF